MTYALSEARDELLETLADAIEELAFSLACLEEAYERLDDHSQEVLEDGAFRSVQTAFGRAKRTQTEFAARHGIAVRSIEEPDATTNSRGAAGFLERAAESASSADLILAGLQDSMLPIEAGDEELRSGLAAVRERLAAVPEQVRGLTRTLGR